MRGMPGDSYNYANAGVGLCWLVTDRYAGGESREPGDGWSSDGWCGCRYNCPLH